MTLKIDVTRSKHDCPTCNIFLACYMGRAYCSKCGYKVREHNIDDGWIEQTKPVYREQRWGYCNHCGVETFNKLCCSLECYNKWRAMPTIPDMPEGDDQSVRGDSETPKESSGETS